MNTGNLLRERRKKLGLTLEELAGLVGVTRQTLSRYENGLINVPTEKLGRLAEALRTTPNELLGWRGDEFVEYLPNLRVPILGRISAGLPLYAEEQVEGSVLVEVNSPGEYFALRVQGDSMNAAHIFENNLLIYRQGSTVTLMPQSTNPQHLPQIYDASQTAVRVIGKVIKNEIVFE